MAPAAGRPPHGTSGRKSRRESRDTGSVHSGMPQPRSHHGGAAAATADSSAAPATGARMTVSVRLRPLSSTEAGRGERSAVLAFCEDKVVRICKEGRAGAVLRSEMGAQHEYQFDRVFGTSATQQDIYEAVAQANVMDTLRGHNCTVFAYGATGAGKTHTMLGSAENPGMIPRALADLFRGIPQLEADFARSLRAQALPAGAAAPSKSWRVKLSYLEVYNETIYDLLSDKQRALTPCEDPADFRVKVLGLTEVEVDDAHTVLQLLQQGNARRRMESTAANMVSSRSHAVLQVHVESELLEPPPPRPDRPRRLAGRPRRTVTTSTLSLIDLAGSERAAVTQNRGARLREGANINRSLLALANCINALSGSSGASGSGASGGGGGTGSGDRRVKYRDSKLTHLLKSSLEGNCRLSMVANITPGHRSYEESHNTLKYANRAKDIKMRAGAAPGNRRPVSAPAQHSSLGGGSVGAGRHGLQTPGGTDVEDRLDALEAENQELRSRLSCAHARRATFGVPGLGDEREPLSARSPGSSSVGARLPSMREEGEFEADVGFVDAAPPPRVPAAAMPTPSPPHHPQLRTVDEGCFLDSAAETPTPRGRRGSGGNGGGGNARRRSGGGRRNSAGSAASASSTSDRAQQLQQLQQQMQQLRDESEQQARQLAARVGALEMQNRTLAQLAASKLRVTPDTLARAVEHALAAASDPDARTAELRQLRDTVDEQRQDIARLHDRLAAAAAAEAAARAAAAQAQTSGLQHAPPQQQPVAAVPLAAVPPPPCAAAAASQAQAQTSRGGRRRSYIPSLYKENRARQPTNAAPAKAAAEQSPATASASARGGKKRQSTDRALDDAAQRRMRQKLEHAAPADANGSSPAAASERSEGSAANSKGSPVRGLRIRYPRLRLGRASTASSKMR